MDKQ